MGTRYLLLLCRVVGGTTHGQQRIQKKVGAGECLGVSLDAYFRDMMIDCWKKGAALTTRDSHDSLTYSLTHSLTYYEIS
jgi:hypothetical protein